MLQILLFLGFIAAPIIAYAQQTQTYRSPDGALRVGIIPVSKICSEDRIEVRRSNGALLYRKSYTSPDCEHGMGVVRGAWSPDSEFFVFNVQSTGGHQPWHWPVYFYSRRDNSVRCLDDYVGSIIAPDFTLEAPHLIRIRTRKLLGNFGDDEEQQITVNLSLIGRKWHR